MKPCRLWKRVLIGAVCAAGAVDAGAAPISPFSVPPERNENIAKAIDAIKIGRSDRALSYLRDAVKDKPDLPPARLLLARMLLMGGQSAPGRQELEAAATENPAHPEIHVSFGSLAALDSRFTEAELHFRRASELAGAKGWNELQRRTIQVGCCIGRATAAEMRKDWTAAHKHLLEWLALDPRNGQARQGLARAKFNLNSREQALNELVQAVLDDPTLEPPALSMARFCAAAGETARTEDWMRRAVEQSPGDPATHQAYAMWLLEQGRPEEARRSAETANSLDRSSTEAKKLRGLIARAAGDTAEAEALFAALFRESPDFFVTNHLALTLIAQKDETKRQKALELAQVNARQAPDSAEAAATLGWILFRSGRLNEAEEALEKAASAGQMTPDTAYYKACILHARGKLDEAVALLREAVNSKAMFILRRPAVKWLEGF